MKLSIALAITTTCFGSTQATFLRGLSEDVKGPFDELKCTIEARSDEEKCEESVDADGEPCDYCSISSQGQEAGICVSRNIAEQVQQINPMVTCDEAIVSDKEESELTFPDFSSFKCTLSAFTDEGRCAEVQEESCQYCVLDINGQDAGLCVNDDVANELMAVSDQVSCSVPNNIVDGEDIENIKDVEGPLDVLKCTIEGRTDEEKCEESVDADGEPCDYCTISSQGQEAGLCVSSDLAEQVQQINPMVTCDQTIASNVEESELTFPDFSSFHCTLAAFSDEERCAEVQDESCQYCVLDINGDDAGLCVNDDVAIELMGVTDQVSCFIPTNIKNGEIKDIENIEDVEGPFDVLKCTIEARSDEEKCEESVDADGEPCDYCSISSQGQEAGICVSRDLAEQMQMINPMVTCDQTIVSDKEESELTFPDISAFHCTLAAFTDEGMCAEVQDESCQYCVLDINGLDAGLCVNDDVANELMGVSDQVSCSVPTILVEEDIEDVEGPFDVLKCTIEARSDEEKCEESVDADGEPCDYCSISSQGQEAGICVSRDLAEQMQQINPMVTCDQTIVSDEEESELTFPDISAFHCTLAAFTDEGMCAEVQDESCQYCVLDINGLDAGLCVNDDVANELMGVSDQVSCSVPTILEEEDIKDIQDVEDVEGPFDALKCTIEARSDEEKCEESVDADGEPCDYCSISSQGQEAGICVSSDIAEQMQQVNPMVTCDQTIVSDDEESKLSFPDISAFKCTLSAFTDEGKCAGVEDDCQYCVLDINGQDAGLCVNDDVADILMGASDQVSCSIPTDERVVIESDSILSVK